MLPRSICTALPHVSLTVAPALLLSVLVAGACSDSADSSDLPPLGYGGGIRFSVFESHGHVPADSAGRPGHPGAGPPRLALSIKSLAHYCPAGPLEVELDVSGRVVTAVVGRSLPGAGPCTGWGGSTVFRDFLPLEEGEHTLLIHFKEDVYEYRLSVSDVSVEVDPVRAVISTAAVRVPAVQPEFTTFWRYPPRSLVHHCWSDGEPCRGLAETLVAELELSPLELPGHGHPPFVLPEPGASGEAGFFRYAGEEDLDRLQEALCAFARQHPGVVSWAASWKNEVVGTFLCEV